MISNLISKMKYISVNDELLGIIQTKFEKMNPGSMKRNISIYTSQQTKIVPIDVLIQLDIDYLNFITDENDIIIDNGVIPEGTDEALAIMKNRIYFNQLGPQSEKYQDNTFELKQQEKIVPVHFSILDVMLTTFTLGMFGWFTSITRQKSPTYTAVATVVGGLFGMVVDTILWFMKGAKANRIYKKK